MTTTLSTSTLSVRITMAEPDEPESLTDFSLRFRNLNSLLLVSSLIDQGDSALVKEVSGDWTMTYPSPKGLKDAQTAADSFRVSRARYESPLDILIAYGPYVAGGGGAIATPWTLYKVAKKMADLWDRFNESRGTHSRTKVGIAKDKAEIARYQMEREAIDFMRGAMNLQPWGGLETRTEIPQVPQAAQALSQITNLELRGEPEPV